MSHYTKLGLALAGLLLVACAPDQFRADLGAVFVRAKGDTALATPGGALSSNHVRNDLGLGDTEAAPYVRMEADWGPQRVKAHGFGYEDTGEGTLSNPFGNIPTGAPVTTKMTAIVGGVSWSWDLMPSKELRLAPGVQAAFYSMDIGARTASPAAENRVNTDVLVPEVYFEAEYDFGWLTLGGNIGYMDAHLRDADGRYLDVEALARVRPTREFEIIGGYRYLLLDADGIASDRRFDADVTLTGWFLGFGVRF